MKLGLGWVTELGYRKVWIAEVGGSGNHVDWKNGVLTGAMEMYWAFQAELNFMGYGCGDSGGEGVDLYGEQVRQ